MFMDFLENASQVVSAYDRIASTYLRTWISNGFVKGRIHDYTFSFLFSRKVSATPSPNRLSSHIGLRIMSNPTCCLSSAMVESNPSVYTPVGVSGYCNLQDDRN